MKKQELIILTNELIKELKDIGIPVSSNIEDVVINTRAKARFGACKVRKNRLGQKKFIIEISNEIIGCDTKEIKGVIIHELLHTCSGCFNHGKNWKSYSRLVEDKLGYTIERTQKYEDFGLSRPKEKEKIKYLVKCCGCGMEFPRKRVCNLVKHPESHRCGKCGNILYLKSKNPHI